MNLPHHVVQRGHNRRAVFVTDRGTREQIYFCLSHRFNREAVAPRRRAAQSTHRTEAFIIAIERRTACAAFIGREDGRVRRDLQQTEK